MHPWGKATIFKALFVSTGLVGPMVGAALTSDPVECSVHVQEENKEKFLDMLVGGDSLELYGNMFYQDGETTEYFLGESYESEDQVIFSGDGKIGCLEGMMICVDEEPTGYRIGVTGKIYKVGD